MEGAEVIRVNKTRAKRSAMAAATRGLRAYGHIAARICA
jgi:hypothetical protein